MLEITYKTGGNHVWSPAPIIPIQAWLGDRMIGDYHAVGMAVQAIVVGSNASTRCTVEQWKQQCSALQGKYRHWHQEQHYGFILVRFGYSEHERDVISRLCRGEWNPANKGWFVDEEEYPYLEWLTKSAPIVFPPSPLD